MSNVPMLCRVARVMERERGREREGGRERERERERERAIRTGTFVTKKGHFGNMGNFCNIDGELL